MEIILPYPPSVNHYWYRNGARTFLGKKGKLFRLEVIKLCKDFLTIEEKVSVEIFLFPPDRRKRDIDNVVKPTLDALEHAQVFIDDYQVDKLSVSRRQVIKGGKLKVKIKKL